MKRIALFLLVILAAIGPLGAQAVKKNAPAAAAPDAGTAAGAAGAIPRVAVPAGSVRLENDTPNLVFYLAAPFKSADLNQFLAQPKAVLERIRAEAANLSYLPARTVRPALAVGEGEQLVLGFSLESGASAWRVWYLRLPAKALRPNPPVFLVSLARGLADAAGRPLALSTIDFSLPSMAVRVDGRFVDWLKYDDQLSWTERTPPLKAIRQQAGTSAEIRLADAQFWGKGGTDLEHFRILRGSKELYLMFSSRSLASQGLSYVLRFFDPAVPGRNRYALEIPVDSASGPSLVWEDGAAEPRVAGDFAAADYYVEARFRLADLPAPLAAALAGGWSVEVASIASQPAQSEEFDYGRFQTQTIPKVD